MRPIAAVDMHVDTLLRITEGEGDLTEERADLQVDAPRCRAGGVSLLLMACFTRDEDPEPAAGLDAMLARGAELSRDDGPFRQVRTPAEWHALDDGAIGFLLTIESARPLEGELGRLDAWHDAGVRIVGLTWNAANAVAAGVMADEDEGLTSHGRDVVQRCAELGIAIDFSHLAPRGVRDVLDMDVAVLATHCNAAAVHPHPRNLTDEQLRAIAARDGIVGLNFFPSFLGDAEAVVDLDTVARHAAHMAEVMGPEHVAIGTDLDGISRFPEGFRGHQDLPAFADALAAAGFSEGAIDGVFSGNFRRWWSRASR